MSSGGTKFLYERLLEEEAALRHISFHGAPWDSGVMLADLDAVDIAGIADLIREAAERLQPVELAHG